jgi:hypothetical protein
MRPLRLDRTVLGGGDHRSGTARPSGMTAQRREPDLPAQRLGFALRSLAAELVTERQRTAALRKENAELKAEIEALRGRPTHGPDEDPTDRR